MLLPYSASSTRRSVFWTLLVVAVLAMPVFAGLCFLQVAPRFALLYLLGGFAAVTLLCVWCTIYVRGEPGLIRVALIWIGLLFLLLTIGIALMEFGSPSPLDGNMKQVRARADIQGIRTMLIRYDGANGHYPGTDQGLNALVPRLMEEVPKDAWGTPYVYRCPGRVNPNSYNLFSAGPDRIPDTADDEWGSRLLNLQAKQ